MTTDLKAEFEEYMAQIQELSGKDPKFTQEH